MYSSEELRKRVLSRLGVEEAGEDSPKETTCPFECSSKFSMLDKLNEDVDRLDSNTMTLGTELWKIEAREHAITDLSSHYHNLRSDYQRVEGDVERLQETVRTCVERLDEVDKKLETLDALLPIVSEHKAKIAKLEEHTSDIDARLDDEKRQRKESDSNLSGLLLIGFFAFILLLNKQRLAETQAAVRTLSVSEAEVAARAYIESQTRRMF